MIRSIRPSVLASTLFVSTSFLASVALAEETTSPASDSTSPQEATTAVAAETPPEPATDAAPPPDAAPATTPPASPAPPAADSGVADTTKPSGGLLDGLRVVAGGRAGYAVGAGSVVSNTKLSDVASGAVPLLLELGVRTKSGLGVGLVGGIGFGISGKALDGCGDCSVTMVRVGAEVTQHFGVSSPVQPWVGLGLGLEYLDLSRRMDIQGTKYETSNTYSAFPEVSAHAGVDIGGEHVMFGPFVSATYASYSKVSSDVKCVDGRRGFWLCPLLARALRASPGCARVPFAVGFSTSNAKSKISHR